MYFVFAIKTRHMSVSRDNGKIKRKKMSKLFPCDDDHCDMVKCRRNVNLKGLILSLQQEKMVNSDYCVEYLRSISNKILLWHC